MFVCGRNTILDVVHFIRSRVNLRTAASQDNMNIDESTQCHIHKHTRGILARTKSPTHERTHISMFGVRCQWRFLRVFWQQHVSNKSIRERTKQPTASSLLRQRRLRWFGHIHRMPSSLPVRTVFDFNPNIHGWKRPRGRPKIRWADSVKHDLHSAGLDSINATQMVYDRHPVEGLYLRTANARTRAWP